MVHNFIFTSFSPKLLNLNQSHLSERCPFWLNPHKTEVVITSLIEMLELPSTDHIFVTRPHLYYILIYVIDFFDNVMNKNYDVITLISR